MTQKELDTEQLQNAIESLVTMGGGDPETFEGQLISQLIESSLKLIRDGHDTGQLKLISRSLREMRYAYRVFNTYKGTKRISIFGSARTPESHPDYQAAKTFSAMMADHKWMCITGAANGIMKAGLEGPKKGSSFGLCIRLPFEVPINTVIEGDPKLIIFRYFFTRKLMFISHSDAVAVFPGGVGTLDELFEVLTLIQTGKTTIIPVVLCEGENGIYWHNWQQYLRDHLLKNGWICEADQSLYYKASSPDDAMNHIIKFYKRYHSSRYVKEMLVIRLTETLSDEQVAILNKQYERLIKSGKMEMSSPQPGETDHLDLPRLVFHHTRVDYGIVRQLIDSINDF